MTRIVEYELMRPDQVVQAREEFPVAFIPIGPLEWHGPHLPLGTDGLHAHHIAVLVARRIGGVVLPTLFAGSETVRLPGEGAQRLGSLGVSDSQLVIGMDFPGNSVRSLYFEESAFGITVREVVRLLKAEPFRLLVLLNGHGATNHQRTLRRIALEESVTGRVSVIYRTAWNPPTPPAEDSGHADRWETQIVLSMDESLVQLDALPPRDLPMHYAEFGIVDGRAFDGAPAPGFVLPEAADPRDARKQDGDALIQAAVTQIALEIQATFAALPA